jgi:PTH2 family peptidyl-tRNA hydrolase
MPIEQNPFDDKRLAEIRKDQEDPIVQYYIVRSDVPMSCGKLCAQIAHAAQMFLLRFYEIKRTLPAMPLGGRDFFRVQITEQWINGSFRKVVLRGNVKDFQKIQEELDVFVVRDAGLTEVEPGTETVMVVWPMRKSEQPKLLARLRVLQDIPLPEEIKNG